MKDEAQLGDPFMHRTIDETALTTTLNAGALREILPSAALTACLDFSNPQTVLELHTTSVAIFPNRCTEARKWEHIESSRVPYLRLIRAGKPKAQDPVRWQLVTTSGSGSGSGTVPKISPKHRINDSFQIIVSQDRWLEDEKSKAKS
jgi:hypothetical protein